MIKFKKGISKVDVVYKPYNQIINFSNKRNKNRKKNSGKKRRIFTFVVLEGNLLFVNLKLNDVKTQKYLNVTEFTQKKVILNQEFNGFEGSHDMDEIILIKS